MRPRVADTSLLYAFFDATDAHHGAARAAVAEPGPLVLPVETLLELAGLVLARRDRRSAREAIAHLRALPHAETTHATRAEAAWAIFDRHPSLSLVDAICIEHAIRLGCDLDSFDDRQKRAWRAELRR